MNGANVLRDALAAYGASRLIASSPLEGIRIEVAVARPDLRLIGMLLAAAPHLPDLLDELAPCVGAHNEAMRNAWTDLNTAIMKAGEFL